MGDPSSNVRVQQPAEARAGLPRAVSIALVGTVVIIVVWYSPFGLQKRNLILAQRHVDLIMPLIRADSRFQGTHIGVYTGNNGSLWVGGIVKSKADLDALRDLVVASKPPVETLFRVFVRSTEADEPRMLHVPDVPAYRSSRTFL